MSGKRLSKRVDCTVDRTSLSRCSSNIVIERLNAKCIKDRIQSSRKCSVRFCRSERLMSAKKITRSYFFVKRKVIVRTKLK